MVVGAITRDIVKNCITQRGIRVAQILKFLETHAHPLTAKNQSPIPAERPRPDRPVGRRGPRVAFRQGWLLECRTDDGFHAAVKAAKTVHWRSVGRRRLFVDDSDRERWRPRRRGREWRGDGCGEGSGAQLARLGVDGGGGEGLVASMACSPASSLRGVLTKFAAARPGPRPAAAAQGGGVSGQPPRALHSARRRTRRGPREPAAFRRRADSKGRATGESRADDHTGRR